MKNLILIFLLITQNIFSQTKPDSIIIQKEKIEKSYEKSLNEYEKIVKHDDEVERYISAEKEFFVTFNKLKHLDNLSNKQLQKALIQDYVNEYYDLFQFVNNGKKVNFLMYGFENKDDLDEYIDNAYYFLLTKTSILISDKVIAQLEKEVKEEDIYINKNLKRLGIKRSEWDNMSENDKDILWKTFKK